MAFPTDHNSVANSMHQMVYNKISFLIQSETTDELISNYILETCGEFEACLSIDGDVGLEGSYSIAQKSFITDLVVVSLLARIAAENSSGSNTFLSAAKAGSVEVAYEQFDDKAGLTMSAEKLQAFYKEQGERRGLKLGCKVTVLESDLIGNTEVGFKVVSG